MQKKQKPLRKAAKNHQKMAKTGDANCHDIISVLLRHKLKVTGRKVSQQLNICCDNDEAEYSKERLKECHDISQLCRDIICEECKKSML